MRLPKEWKFVFSTPLFPLLFLFSLFLWRCFRSSVNGFYSNYKTEMRKLNIGKKSSVIVSTFKGNNEKKWSKVGRVKNHNDFQNYFLSFIDWGSIHSFLHFFKELKVGGRWRGTHLETFLYILFLVFDGYCSDSDFDGKIVSIMVELRNQDIVISKFQQFQSSN